MNRLRSVARELEAFTSEGKWKILGAIAVGWGMLLGTRMIYPVVLPFLRAEFDLTLTTAGLLISILWFVYALGQSVGGMLVDQKGERLLLTGSVVIVAGGISMVVIAPSRNVLFLATATVGIGMSLYPIARLTALSKLYPNRIGGSMGITMASGDIGQTVIPPLVGAIAVAMSWRAGFGFVVPFLIVIAIVLWLFLPATPPTGTASSLSFDRIGRVIEGIRQPALGLMSLILFIFIFVWQTFSAFYPTYLISLKGLSPTAASVLFGLFFAVGIIVKPIAGMGFDRFGARKSLPLVLVGSVIGLSMLPLVTDYWSLVVVTVLIGSTKGSGAIVQSYLVTVIPADIQGTGLGMIRSAAATLGATGPLLFGILADRGLFNEGYWGLAVLIGAVALLTWLLPASREKSKGERLP